MADYPTTLEEARAFLAMRPVERWKVTDRPDGAMERCAELLAAEVERMTTMLASSISASEARRREREAADWAASQVVAELSGGEYRAARDARYPEVPNGQD